MFRNITRTTLTVATLVVLTTGCGRLIEEATEEAVERAVEADTGGDVEVEFNDDGISVESDDGNVTLSADEDGVEIDGTDADGNEFSVDADEDGINAESEDGSFDIDSDGTFTATDADGDVSTGQISADDDSVDFTIEGEDGDSVFTSGAGIPAQWPSGIPQPVGLDDVFGTYVSDDDFENISITGTTSDNAEDAFDDYASLLVDAGFEESSRLNQGSDFFSATFTDGDTTVSVTTQRNGDSTDVVIGIS